MGRAARSAILAYTSAFRVERPSRRDSAVMLRRMNAHFAASQSGFPKGPNQRGRVMSTAVWYDQSTTTRSQGRSAARQALSASEASYSLMQQGRDISAWMARAVSY